MQGSFSAIFDADNWAAVPFGFWTLVFFVFGSIVGSFLNVCIYRMPLGLSVVNPPSHCPHCKYSIPWYLNVPLVTWLYLKGKCAKCSAPISARYFGVELLTGLLFMGAWIAVGHGSAVVAVVYSLVLAGLVVATFIDFEHFIIPDEITLGGIVVGVILSLAIPAIHGVQTVWQSGILSLVGVGVGAGLTYAILRLGKLLFGKQEVKLEPDTLIQFNEEGLQIGEEKYPFEELFYRKSDRIEIEAKRVELLGKVYEGVKVVLSPELLRVGGEKFDPEQVPEMKVWADGLVLPREAMGLGDVKFLGAIGAFLGWQGAMFSLMASAVIGTVVGVLLILFRKREWSSKLPYGPYIALAAVIWMFWGERLVNAWLSWRG